MEQGPTAGKLKGLAALVKSVAPLVVCNHCCIHREALTSKCSPSDLQNTLNEAVKNVNNIKSLTQNTHLFKTLCEEIGSDHTQLLLHTRGTLAVAREGVSASFRDAPRIASLLRA
jgi:hypothetical protein